MRTAGSITMGMVFPPKGKYNCLVIGVEKGVSQNKKTPYVEPVFSSGEFEFNDQLYVTPKTIGRLSHFARKVCNMSDDYELPDNDIEASHALAKFIMDNALNKKCVVTIDEFTEKFIPLSGPDMGRTIEKTRRRVAFRGYEKIQEDAQQETVSDDDLPF